VTSVPVVVGVVMGEELVVGTGVTGGELVVGGTVAGVAVGLKKLCKGVSGVVPALVSAGKVHR
jgi:hypothetical protein